MTQIVTAETTQTPPYRGAVKRWRQFAYWFPHRSIPRTNPFRQIEVGRASPIFALREMTRKWMLYTVLVLCVGWLIGAMYITINPGRSWVNDAPKAWYDLWETMGWILGAIAVADRFIYDFIAMIFGINSISHDLNSGRWELISMTDVNVDDVVRAKHAAVQIRAWRAMSIVMGLRLGIIVVLILHFLLGLSYAFTNGDSDFGEAIADMWQAIERNPLNLGTLILLLLIPIVGGTLFVVEARWRLRVIAAASLSVSSRIRSTTMGLLYGFGTLLAFWVTQVFIGIITLFVTSSTITPFSNWAYRYSASGDEFAFLFFLGLFAGVVTAGIVGYTVYHDLTDFWLSNAARRLITRRGASIPRRYYPTRAFLVVFCLFVLFWGYYVAGTIHIANHPEYQFYSSPLPDTYYVGVGMVFAGLFASIAFQLTLDFITLLATKHHNDRVQYTTGKSRIGREINLLMGLRIATFCAGLLQYLLGLKLLDELTWVNGVLGIVVFLVMLTLQILEVKWSQMSLWQMGSAIETRLRFSLLQISAIYLVVLARWVVYPALFLLAMMGLRNISFFATSSDDIATRILLFGLAVIVLLGVMIFGVHMGIRRLLPKTADTE